MGEMERRLVAQVDELAEDRIERNARIRDLEAERDRLREALDAFVKVYEWAYNDSLYTAPEDHARRGRQWEILGDKAIEAREALAQGEDDGQ